MMLPCVSCKKLTKFNDDATLNHKVKWFKLLNDDGGSTTYASWADAKCAAVQSLLSSKEADYVVDLRVEWSCCGCPASKHTCDCEPSCKASTK